jgi:pimeloyl-ACP methyl ester carboxylesterase
MCDDRLWRDVERPSGWTHANAAIKDHDTIEALACTILNEHDGPVILIGFSMGAIVALMMTKLAPERVSGLILSSTNCTADLPDRARNRVRQQDVAKAGNLNLVVRDELKPHYLSPSTTLARRTAILDLTFAMGMDLGPDVFVRQSEALRTRLGLCDVLDQVSCPVLIMAGQDDVLCPPDWHQKMAARTPLATYVEVPHAGHLVPLEAPELFGSVLSDWLLDHFPSTRSQGEAHV